MDEAALIPHLFRTEYRKIVSVLCKRYGFDQIEIAEDLASNTFLSAYQSWPINGVPVNPVAWLHYVSKNKAKNYVKRKLLFETRIAPEIKDNASTSAEFEIDLSPQNSYDSQLQMMFAICNPLISVEAQVGLSLRILCGFGIGEIADAFLTNKETINKRLFRAKEKLREAKIQIEFPKLSEINNRLEGVLTTIYLLFNEGYYSISQNTTIRKDLCFEAMRLCDLLLENGHTNTPVVNALSALMCFQASRIDARTNKNNELILYSEQDTSLWDAELISKGACLLSLSATGNEISKYHIEASIAYWSTQKKDTKEKWESVLKLYDLLLENDYSPNAIFNRAFALSKVYGKQHAIVETEKLELTDNHFYYMLLGELYLQIDPGKALQNLVKAAALAKTPSAARRVLWRSAGKAPPWAETVRFDIGAPGREIGRAAWTAESAIPGEGSRAA